MPRPAPSVALGVSLALSLLSGPAALAQAAALPAIVGIRPVGPSGLEGIAILAADGELTRAQVQVTAPPAGTSAVVHPGTCDALDPMPVALLGDVGSGGLITTTVPLPLAAIADGAHAIALHPGLDLGTVLGCGVIPLAVGSVAATPVPPTPPVDVYAGTRYAFTLTWSEPWARGDHQGGEGIVGLTLHSGTSTVIVEAFDLAGCDATACLEAWEDGLLGALRRERIVGVAPGADASGTVIWGGDARRSQGAYSWARPSQPDLTWTEAVVCRRLPRWFGSPMSCRVGRTWGRPMRSPSLSPDCAWRARVRAPPGRTRRRPTHP